ncbi:Predicted membrane protein [Chlamydia trachomatis]|nr:Predicted membrane protein [Chlamydia trachomatis]
MSIITIILGTLVALEFFYIFYLEMIATTSAATARVFKMSQEELQQKNVTTLFKNQGVYNLLIGVLILIAIYIFPSATWLGNLASYVILVAIYGGITSDKMIILKQGDLAILTLLTLLF